MVIHYSVENSQVACGRNNHNVTAATQRDRVTCKSCLRSEKFADSTAEAIHPVKTVPPAAACNWRYEWALSAQAQRPNDRLPRGIKRVAAESRAN